MTFKDYQEGLLALDESVWERYAFESEPLKGKISFDKYKGLYQKALVCGKEISDEFKSKGITTPKELSSYLGAKVKDLPLEGNYDKNAFALFIEPDTIEIFKDNADECSNLIQKSDEDKLKSVSIYNVLLTHELFHLRTARDKDLFINQKHIVLFKLFKWENKAQLQGLEESAAMAFTRAFLNLEYNPMLLGVLMLYPRAEKQASKLYNSIQLIKNMV